MKFENLVIASFQITINNNLYDILVLLYSRETRICILQSLYTCSICISPWSLLDYGQASNKGYIWRTGAYQKAALTVFPVI